MDTAVVTGLAGAVGSLVGASASIATTWITQRTQALRENREWRLREREALYKEFIAEASRLTIDALGHSLERPEQFVPLYAILSRIRLVSDELVLVKAEECCRGIVELYRRPNLTAAEIHAAFESDELDLLKAFSSACRTELLAMSSIA